MKTDGAVLTERQQKWFATVRANFEKQTGRPLEAWVEIMKTCPETAHRAQAVWLKSGYCLGQNHAAQILDAVRAEGSPGWDEPAALRATLWKDAGSLAILEAVEAVAAGVEGVMSGQRKGYTAFSRPVQFAAIRPLKGGRALLGLKLEPEVSARLSAAVRKESWSERLSAVVELDDAAAVDGEIARLFAAAAERG
ncbi:DUF4287 domain-containing protein [Brevundimonas sp. R86498]|uniref:DUF4287 domain-containing protein n=1 Tax=Brevundimonas sp. R86498 TaxID=3093845 RepID=UPI0037C5D0C7